MERRNFRRITRLDVLAGHQVRSSTQHEETYMYANLICLVTSRFSSMQTICFTGDVILLFMIVRQSLVFRIEQRSNTTGREFIAGHNYSVCKDMEKLNFVNPVKDYVSQIHNWLDVFKRGSMMSLLWITLSIMFLAGTKRTNLFSLGYLIGAFVFLWQGSDFYLRPVKTILKWWNILIGYNIFVIFCKTIFQGVGCVLVQNVCERLIFACQSRTDSLYLFIFFFQFHSAVGLLLGDPVVGHSVLG